MDKLKELIHSHRKKSGLTQIELAQLAGVGKTVVFDIEHGKQSIRLDTLMRLLKVLNITVSFTSPLLSKEINEKN